jgi:hypothetical protein
MRRPVPVLLAVLALLALPPSLSEPGTGAVALDVECSKAPWRMMEFSYSDPTCWNHSGIHTYFLGLDQTLRLRSVRGLAFSVEEQFSAPTEGLMVDAEGIGTPVIVEVSMDGLDWALAGTGRYEYLSDDFVLGNVDCTITGEACPDLFGLVRQNVFFDITGEDQEFRLFRVRHPASAATHGLSGFLDHTRLVVEVAPGAPIAAPVLAQGSRTLPCTAVLEDVVAEHPCWYGGIDRYDSPSFFHTWFLGGIARLDHVAATATLLPWRLDDFYQPGITATDLLTAYTLEGSVTGVAWFPLAQASGPFGQALTASADLPGTEVQFLRIAPEKHARYHQFNQFPPNHHPRAYIVDSAATVEGMLP